MATHTSLPSWRDRGATSWASSGPSPETDRRPQRLGGSGVHIARGHQVSADAPISRRPSESRAAGPCQARSRSAEASGTH